MNPKGALLLGLLMLAGTSFLSLSSPQSDDGKPEAAREVQYAEEVQVRLVILDVVVLDEQGRAVPGLGKDDFEIIAGREQFPVETLDVACRTAPADASPGPEAPPQGAVTAEQEGPRRIVLALDYQHMARTRRFRVLEQVIAMVRAGASGGDEIMVVALNGGLRVEQRFTRDMDRVAASLERMQYDVSLWQPGFHHLNEAGFVGAMTAMLEYLGTVPGAKAVVLFSEMGHVPLDLQFREIAAVAAAARCSIYPVDVSGLVPVEPEELGLSVPDTASFRRGQSQTGFG